MSSQDLPPAGGAAPNAAPNAAPVAAPVAAEALRFLTDNLDDPNEHHQFRISRRGNRVLAPPGVNDHYWARLLNRADSSIRKELRDNRQDINVQDADIGNDAFRILLQDRVNRDFLAPEQWNRKQAALAKTDAM